MILRTLILADWLIKLREGVLCYLGEKNLGFICIDQQRRCKLAVGVLWLRLPATVDAGSSVSHV